MGENADTHTHTYTHTHLPGYKITAIVFPFVIKDDQKRQLSKYFIFLYTEHQIHVVNNTHICTIILYTQLPGYKITAVLFPVCHKG